MSRPCASTTGCPHAPTMAIRTTAPKGGGLKTTVYWDPSDAPKSAEPHCLLHGAALLEGLAKTLGRQQ